MRLLSTAAGLVLLALVALPAQGDDSATAIRARMQAFVDRHDIAGAVTVVGRKDAIVSYEAVGSQNLESGQPMTKDAIFRIASMTKPVTALGIMILADEGKLSVEDPVEKHLPAFKGQMLVVGRSKDAVMLTKPARPITLRDLLTHTSGLPGGMPPGLSDLYLKRNHTLAEAVMAFSQRPLDFEPGSRWAYCNAGIDTLGRVIEVCSGKSYEEFLQQRIFAPLGMTDTTFFPTGEQHKRVATTYGKKDGQLVPTPHALIDLPPGSRYPLPAGGLYSTGADLAKLYQLMLGRGTLGQTRIVSPESVAAMTKVQTGDLKTGFVDGMGFGLGWGVVREPKGITAMLSPGAYGHGGAFGTQAWIDPQQDLFAILLIQRTGLPNSDASDMRKEFQQLAVQAIKR
jgi:CubicO group peptidase (beta-lactamase class C family)